MKLIIGYTAVFLAGIILGGLISLAWIPNSNEGEEGLGEVANWDVYENEDFMLRIPRDFELSQEPTNEAPVTVLTGPNDARLEIFSTNEVSDRPIQVATNIEEREVYDQVVPKGTTILIDGDRYELRFWYALDDISAERAIHQIIASFEDKNRQRFTQ